MAERGRILKPEQLAALPYTHSRAYGACTLKYRAMVCIHSLPLEVTLRQGTAKAVF